MRTQTLFLALAVLAVTVPVRALVAPMSSVTRIRVAAGGAPLPSSLDPAASAVLLPHNLIPRGGSSPSSRLSTFGR